MQTYTHTETHAQVVLSFQTKHFFRRMKNQASPPQQWVHCVTEKDTVFGVHVFRMSVSCLQCKTVVSEEQITQNWHCNYSVTIKRRDRKLLLPLSPPSLQAFIPLPSLPVMIPICLVAHVVHPKMADTCGRNRMLSQRYRAKGFGATRYPQDPNTSHLCSRSVLTERKEVDLNSFHRMPQSMRFTMTMLSVEFTSSNRVMARFVS